MTLVDLARRVEAAVPLPSLPAPVEARQLRVAAGVSLETAGALVGASAATVHRWEEGRSRPRVAASVRYRKFLAAAQGGAA